MIIDALNKFCENEEVDTGAAGYYQLGSTIDLGLAPGDIGGGEPLYLVITATQAIAAASGGEVEFHLASDAAASFTTPETSTLHVGVVLNTSTSTTAIPAGSVLLCVPVPSEGVEEYERYLGIVQRTSTAAITSGYINAFLTPTPQKWKALADGIPNPA